MTFWVAGAVVGSALIGSQGAKSAASSQADAATKAADVQTQSNKDALALQEKLYREQVALQEPYRQAGLTGQNRLMELLGLGGNTSAADYGSANRQFSMNGFDPNSLMKNFTSADYQADPGYAFRLSEGMKQLGHQAAGRGGAVSGTSLKGLQDYAQNSASQEYQNAFNRFQANRSAQGQEYGNAFNRFQTERTNMLQPLGNLMASGQSAASNQGSAAGAYGSNGANLITGAGNAIASGITNAGNAIGAGQLGQANTFANGLGTAASTYQNTTNFNNWLNRNQPNYVIPMQAGGGY